MLKYKCYKTAPPSLPQDTSLDPLLILDGRFHVSDLVNQGTYLFACFYGTCLETAALHVRSKDAAASFEVHIFICGAFSSRVAGPVLL